MIGGIEALRKFRLGRTGLMVSRVGMGGIPITRTPKEKVVEVVHTALDLGVNFIDTAIGYSDSEERIGRGLSGRRDEVYIATKGGWSDAKTTQTHIEASLKRLGVNSIDLWQFHGVQSPDQMKMILSQGGAMEAAYAAQKAGKIHHVGASSHNLEAAKAIVKSEKFETIQFPFNCLSPEYEELVELSKDYDVGFIAMKPFAGGTMDNPHLAMGYLLQFPTVLPIPGIEKPDEIKEVVELTLNPPKLSEKDITEIKELKAKLGSRYCRQCEYCMPCPQGVYIAGILYTKRLYDLWPDDRFFNWEYVKRSIASAKNCVQCGVCEPKCLFELPIREMIKENIEFYDRVETEYNSRMDKEP